MTQKVAQTQSTVPVLEMKAATTNCVYETSDHNYSLFWYEQSPHGEMIFLVCQNSYSEYNATEGLYSVSFQKAAKSIKLSITAPQITDSAVFFCALREDTVRRDLQGT